MRLSWALSGASWYSTQVLISGSKRGLTPVLKKLLRRRSAIDPEIGHMKSDGRFARYSLKGLHGDAIFVVLRRWGHNLGKILRHLRSLFVYLLAAILKSMQQMKSKAARNQGLYTPVTA